MLARASFKAMVALVLAGPASALSGPPETSAVDRVFALWARPDTPGCAVGVAQQGRAVLERAYGMADLEHAIPNTPDTIFEAGSVSKQFTATAVVLLAQAGALALDDPVRRHVPEVPDYGVPVTMRQMLHHLSGLRDWGVVAFAAGWPRGTRVHTQDHVLDIVSRQGALNYPPGTEYLYSNTGYNLAAITVGRVKGVPFAEFTRESIFEPLGMGRTRWRDDFTRIVPGRAQAYSRIGDAYRLEMPFENVHGNGGLLTTVGDLLKWNENFSHPRVGGESLVAELQTPGRLEDGREIRYGLGLSLGSYRGVSEIAHSGTTAGYRAFLARYPESRLSVAVLCNAGEAPAPDLGRQVAALFLGDALRPAPAPATLTADQLASRAGLYRSLRSGDPWRIVLAEGKLRLDDGDELFPASASELRVGRGSSRLVFTTADGFRYESAEGELEEFRRARQAAPSAAELGEYAGQYVSDEAEVTYGIEVKDGGLVLKLRAAAPKPLSPAYRDAFTGPAGFILFRRDPQGRIEGLSLGLGRVRDLRFRRAELKG